MTSNSPYPDFLGGNNLCDWPHLLESGGPEQRTRLRRWLWLLILPCSLLFMLQSAERPTLALAQSDECPGGGIVESGDTLYDIANRFGTNVVKLAELNDLDDPNLIVVGTCLDLGFQAACAGHVVWPGDTLGALASHYGVTVQELVDLNQIDNPDLIHVGECLVLGDVTVSMSAPEPVEEPRAKSTAEMQMEADTGLASASSQATASAPSDVLALTGEWGPIPLDQAWDGYWSGDPGPQMSVEDVARLLRDVGFCTYGVEDLVLMTATIGTESGYYPYILGDVNINYQGDVSIGLSQIYWSPGGGYTDAHREPAQNLDPRTNLEHAYLMYSWKVDSGNWNTRFGDWYGFANRGRFMDTARQAVNNIGGCA